jgi:hypothetical protein
MAMSVGSPVSINQSTGATASGSGLSLEIYNAMVAAFPSSKVDAGITYVCGGLGYRLNLDRLNDLAHMSNAIAAAVVAHLIANATISGSDIT